jgi:hypothetical protein
VSGAYRGALIAISLAFCAWQFDFVDLNLKAVSRCAKAEEGEAMKLTALMTSLPPSLPLLSSRLSTASRLAQ